VTTSKSTGRRASRRASASKPSNHSHPARASSPQLAAFTEEWWKSWRQANALAWEYLNAVSGLMRLNMSAFARVPHLPMPFQTQ
jgi:hypothetical protein